MPTYTFHCKSCKAEFSVMRSMRDYNNPARCVCGEVTRERVISSPFVSVGGTRSPSSNAQKLAGKRVKVPSVKGETSVLGHACHSGCSH